jgi:phosphoribosyl 1,2-cyclic phosphodiesterase
MRLDALLLECNHDPDLLASGPYPPALKKRVGGQFGHLSNKQAAGLLERIECSGLQHLLAAHLSDKNNHPDLAREALAKVLGCHSREISVADQEGGFDWRQMT